MLALRELCRVQLLVMHKQDWKDGKYKPGLAGYGLLESVFPTPVHVGFTYIPIHIILIIAFL